MSAPTIRPSRTQAVLRVAMPSRLMGWHDDARRLLLRPVPALVATLSAWRRRARDHAALQELGARELRDIGLVRHEEVTVGERAFGRL